MTTFKKRVCWSLVFLLATTGLLHAQETSPQDIQESCRNFVQGFYNWYMAGHGTLDYIHKDTNATRLALSCFAP